MNDRVAIFTRAPIAGRVKTRLADAIGPVDALACYSSILARTIEVVADFDAELWVDNSMEDDSWTSGLTTRIQSSGDLGTRMYAAFQDGVTVIVGGDIPLINKKHIEKAIEHLNSNDLVIGPAEDGGYYLIAMKEPRKKIFEDISWGSESVLADTLRNVDDLSVEFTETLWDLDDVTDYNRWLKTISL